MSGKRAAAIALSLVIDLADRLDAAGVSPENAPTLDQGLDLVWPLARQLSKLERTGKRAALSAGDARAAVLDEAVARWVPATAELARPVPVRWRKFDPAAWHVALVPAPAREREHEVA